MSGGWQILGTLGIRVNLAGRVGVAVGTAWVIHERQFRDRQGRRAFAYLAHCRGRPVPRGELARIIWPDEAPPAWESALSALVSRLRRLLEHADLKRFGVALSSGFGQDQLLTPAETWVDLEAAAAAIDEAEGALRAGDPLRAFGFAGVTYAIAPRPFLSGDDGTWVESQRRTLERQFMRAHIDFELPGRQVIGRDFTVLPTRTLTISANDLIVNSPVSAKVTTRLPSVVERTMFFSRRGRRRRSRRGRRGDGPA